MPNLIYKYPKTPRLNAISPDKSWNHLTTVVEEKVDGACVGIHFENEKLILQTRRSIITGKLEEIQFNPLITWASENADELYKIIGEQYVVFGEWCYAVNRLFYDDLPSYFIEFDVLDKTTNQFLSTSRRKAILSGRPINSVVIIHSTKYGKINNFYQYIGNSNYKTDKWREKFNVLMNSGLRDHYSENEIDNTQLMEGVYIKLENDDYVLERIKIPRPEFEKVKSDDQKWLKRPIFPNQIHDRSP